MVTLSSWTDMTKRERQSYVLGVLEGWSFDLYSAGHPDLKPLVECVTGEGVERITEQAQNAMVLGEAENPAPWWIASALGAACEPYR
jgi:hypothetical protein